MSIAPFDCCRDNGIRINGRPVCRWCGSEVPRPRRSWCHDDCVEQYLLQTAPSYLRTAVYRRDRGICLFCGLDTDELDRRVSRVMRAVDRATRERRWGTMEVYPPPGKRRIEAVLGRMGFSRDPWQSKWEADHIIALADGGPHGPRNVRTLCVPCHKGRTASWQAERAERRRVQRRLPI